MSNINSAAVEEISNAAAAMIQGGRDAIVYKHANQVEELGSYRIGTQSLSSRANDQISSIVINSGVWAFFEHARYRGRFFILTKGSYNLTGLRSFWNDRISSFRKIG
ncbi:MAG: hypothetical protein OHK0037_31590 [Elainellaceae cyanobacterium]